MQKLPVYRTLKQDLNHSSKVIFRLLNNSDSLRWYFGKIKRTEAEQNLLLPHNDSGAFLIRDSESRRSDYSLSVKDGDSVKHYRVR